MPTRKLKEKNIRKLTRMGGGRCLGLTLPAEIVAELGLRERQKVKIKVSRRRIIISDWKK